jgi:hypothetical protein
MAQPPNLRRIAPDKKRGQFDVFNRLLDRRLRRLMTLNRETSTAGS